jgi:hypothetical protein
MAQLTRAFLVMATSVHLGSCRRFTSFYVARLLANGAGRANNKGKPDQLRFRHYRLNKLGNVTLEILTTATMTIIILQRDAQ